MLKGIPVFDIFLDELGGVIDAARGREAEILDKGQAVLARLVGQDDWLPAEFAEPHPEHFKQYILHKDPSKPLSVICVVWGPGQSAVPHDHTVWGLIGQLRGAERTRSYADPIQGQAMRVVEDMTLRAGETTAVAPSIGDIHDVENAIDGVSVSIHVYGGDLSELVEFRHRYDAATGKATAFIANYY